MKQPIFTADDLIRVYGETNVQTQQPTQAPKKDLLQKTTDVVTSIFPGKQVGETLGTAFVGAKQALKGDKQGAYETIATAPKVGQVVGDVAKGAALVAGVKAPVPTSVAGRIAQTSALGATQQAGQAMTEDKNIGQVATDAVKGAVIGGAVQGLFDIAPALSNILGNSAKNLRIQNLRLSPIQKTQFKDKVDEVVSMLKQNGIKGNPTQQYNQVEGLYNNAEKVVQSSIQQSGKKYTAQELVNDFLKIPEKYAGEFDNPDVYAKLNKQAQSLATYVKNNLTKKYGNEIPAEVVNNLKRSYMKNAFNKGGDAIVNEANLTIGDELYKKLLNDIPELENINKTYSNIITARKLLGKALGRNEIGFFGNLLGTGVGTAVGSSVGGVPGAIAGATLARPIAKKIAGTSARTNYAKGLEKVSDTLKKSKGSKAPRVMSTILND